MSYNRKDSISRLAATCTKCRTIIIHAQPKAGAIIGLDLKQRRRFPPHSGVSEERDVGAVLSLGSGTLVLLVRGGPTAKSKIGVIVLAGAIGGLMLAFGREWA